VEFKPEGLSSVGRLVFRILSTLRLVVVRPSGKDDGQSVCLFVFPCFLFVRLSLC